MLNLTSLISPIFFQLLGTIILLLIISKFTYKNFVDMLDKRNKTINDTITNTKNKEQEAEKYYNEILEEKNNIKKEKIQILEDMQQKAKEEKNEIINQAKIDAQNIIDESRKKIIENQKEKEKEILDNIYEYIALVSNRYIQDNLDKEKEMMLIDEAIKKVGNE